MAACTLGNLFLQLSHTPASHLIFRGAVTTLHYRLRKFYLPVGNNCFQIMQLHWPFYILVAVRVKREINLHPGC